MDRTPVKSSNLKSVGYDPETETLEVEFKAGTVYRYADVPAEVHAALMAAESVGSYYARNVRGKFESEKVEPEPETAATEPDRDSVLGTALAKMRSGHEAVLNPSECTVIVDELRTMAQANWDAAAAPEIGRLHAQRVSLRQYVTAVESECRNELARGVLLGLPPDGPHAQLWTGLRDQAKALLRETAK